MDSFVILLSIAYKSYIYCKFLNAEPSSNGIYTLHSRLKMSIIEQLLQHLEL